MSTHTWRNELAVACRKGLNYPEESLPDAGLFIGALLEVHPYGEEKLGTDWKAFAEKHPYFADLMRLAASRFKFDDQSQPGLNFPRAPGHIRRRMKVSLATQNEQTSQGVHSHATPSTQPQLVLQGDIQPIVQNQTVVARDENPSPAYPPRQVTVIPEPQIRTDLNVEEYGELVKRLWKREGTKEEITARILNESHEKELQDFRERRDHPERWEERQRQKRQELRRQYQKREERRRDRSRERRRERRHRRRERQEREESRELQG